MSTPSLHDISIQKIRNWASSILTRAKQLLKGSVKALLQLLVGSESALKAGKGHGSRRSGVPDGMTIKVDNFTIAAWEWLLGGFNASLAVSRSTHRFAVSDAACCVLIGDSRSAKIEHTLSGHSFGIGTLDFSADGTLLASAGGDESIRLWNVADGSLRHVLNGHTGWVCCVAVSPDGRTVASRCTDNTVRLWDSSDGRCIRALEGFAYWGVLAISPDGQYVVGGNPNGVILVRRLSDGAPTATLTGHKAGIQVMRFSPDGRLLATGGNDGSIRIWDTADWSLRGVSTNHTNWVRDLCFSPDGALLASASDDRSASVVRTADLGLHLMLRGHEGCVLSVAFSDDNRQLVSASNDGRLRIWNVADGELLHELTDQDGTIINIAVVDGVIVSRSIESVSIRTFADPQNARSITMQCER